MDLDQPVTTYLPWLTFSRPEFSSGVTLRTLLSHSSGLFGTAGNFGPRDLSSLARFIRETVPSLKFVAPPGLVYEYSSLGIDLAGYVAEVVGGYYFPDVVQQNLLDPLHMRHTTYDRTVAMTYPVALPHTTMPDGEPRVQHRMFDYAAANPAGQAMASTLDLARFVSMAMNGGWFEGCQVLSVELAEQMRRPHISFRDAEASGHGLGFFALRYRGWPWIAHGGMLTPYLCEISFLPEQGIGVVWQCNATNDFDPYLVRRLILDSYLDQSPGPTHTGIETRRPKMEVPSYAPYEGTYFSLAAGFATITPDDDHLIIERRDSRTALYPIGAERFASQDGAVEIGFIPENSDRAQYFMLDEHAFGRFERPTSVQHSDVTLQNYAGRYLFDDGDTATAWVQEDVLHLALSWMEGYHPCLPLTDSTFASDVGLVEFRRSLGQPAVLIWAGGVVAEAIDEESPSPSAPNR